jgi:hypothetical protein
MESKTINFILPKSRLGDESDANKRIEEFIDDEESDQYQRDPTNSIPGEYNI